MMGYKIWRRVTSLDGEVFYPGSSVVVLEDNGDTCTAMVTPHHTDPRGGLYEFRTDDLRKAYP